MERLRTPEVFRFCAIPQVMAIATLEKVYSNADVFSGVVKIRKGLACKLILEANDMPQLYACFARFAARIAATAEGLRGPALAGTPTQQRTLALCRQIQALCASKAGATSSNGGALYTAGVIALVGGPVLAAVARLVGLAPLPSPAALRRGLLPAGQGAAGVAQVVAERVVALSPADGLRLAVCLVVAVVLTVVLSAVVLAVLPSTPRPKSAAVAVGVGGGGSGNGKKQGNSAAAGKGKAMAASQ
jgi:hypothetical protein